MRKILVGKSLFWILFFSLLTHCSPLKSTKVLTGLEGKIQLTVPGGWKEEKDLNESADLQASHRISEMYVVILSENKEDFQDMSLEKHSELTRGSLIRKLDNAKISDPIPLTLDGHPAVEYEIHGAMDHINIVYLHTTVETQKYFHQILAWTLPSRYEKNRATLQKVIENFRETSQAPAASPKP